MRVLLGSRRSRLKVVTICRDLRASYISISLADIPVIVMSHNDRSLLLLSCDLLSVPNTLTVARNTIEVGCHFYPVARENRDKVTLTLRKGTLIMDRSFVSLHSRLMREGKINPLS